MHDIEIELDVSHEIDSLTATALFGKMPTLNARILPNVIEYFSFLRYLKHAREFSVTGLAAERAEAGRHGLAYVALTNYCRLARYFSAFVEHGASPADCSEDPDPELTHVLGPYRDRSGPPAGPFVIDEPCIISSGILLFIDLKRAADCALAIAMAAARIARSRRYPGPARRQRCEGAACRMVVPRIVACPCRRE